MHKLALVAAATMIAFAPAAIAQKKKKEEPVANDPKGVPTGIFFKGQEATQTLARDRLMGAKVLNASGQVIGDIEDLILGPKNEVQGVIMGVGGFLGAGEKKIGVRLVALKFEEKDGKRTVSLPQVTKEMLAVVEPYKRAQAEKTLLQKAGEKTKELTDKTKETVKDTYDKATKKQ